MVEIFSASEAEYHASPGVSNSQLTTFSESPLLYLHRHILKDWDAPPPTKDMRFGSMLHRVMPPGTLEDARILRIPPEVLSAKGHRRGNTYYRYIEQYPDHTILSEDEFEAVDSLYDNALKHPKAWLLTDAEHVEANIRWIDARTGLLLRSRLDRLHIAGEIIVDLKSTNATTAREFADSVAQLGYFRQAAFYREAAFQLTGKVMPFVFCALEKYPPYRVRFYDLDEEFLIQGEVEVRKALEDLKRCHVDDVWSPPEDDEIITLSRPGWHKHEQDWKNG